MFEKFVRALLLGAGLLIATNSSRAESEAAAQLYRLASERGVAQSYCALGNQYRKGLAVEKNERKAVELCRKGADKGLPGAQTDLGEMYLMG